MDEFYQASDLEVHRVLDFDGLIFKILSQNPVFINFLFLILCGNLKLISIS